MWLVFNCGGTNTRVGVSPEGESILKHESFRTCSDFEEQMLRLEEAGNRLLGGGKPDGVCGGVAGVWELDRSRLYNSPHLPDWNGRQFKKRLEQIWKCPITLGNDVEMEGLGEANFGVGRRSKIVGYLAIGTGIGGVKIENGAVCSHVYGFEPGHQVLAVDGEVGYFENFASGSGMEKIHGKKPEDITDSTAWKEETRLLAMGIHNMIVFWSPEMVILGGGIMKKIELNKLKEMVAAHLKIFPKLPILCLGELGEKAGLYGGLAKLRMR